MTNIERAAALRAVLDLHPKSPGQRWVGFPRADRQEHYCMADQQAWPCDTVRALAEVGWLAPLLIPDLPKPAEHDDGWRNTRESADFDLAQAEGTFKHRLVRRLVGPVEVIDGE